MAGADRKRSSCATGVPQAGIRVPVLLPYPFAGPFDYRVPAELTVAAGDVVLVPLNRREEVGVVWDGPTDATVPEHKLKPLLARLDAPPMAEPMRRFIDWIAAYTLSPPGEVMAMALRVARATIKPASAGWRVADPPPAVRITEARARVLAVLELGKMMPTGLLARQAGVGIGTVRAMADAGLLTSVVLPATAPFAWPDPDHAGPDLSPEQEAAAESLREAVIGEKFSVTLLEGVTGSGKTEVYLEALAACLRQGRQVLVLLPEIALSSQWLERF